MSIGARHRSALATIATGLEAARRRGGDRTDDATGQDSGIQSRVATRPMPPIVPAAFAFAIGCGLGVLASSGSGLGDSPVPCQAWFAAAAVAGLGWIFRQRRRRPVEAEDATSKTAWFGSTCWMLAACVLLGAGHAGRSVEREDELRRWLASPEGDPRVVAFRGTVASEPSLPARRDRLHRFLPLASDPGVELRSVSLRDAAGMPRPVEGLLRLIVRHGAVPFPVGTIVEGEGLLHGELPVSNPGGSPTPRATLAGSPLATIVVPDVRLLRVSGDSVDRCTRIAASVRAARAWVRGRVRAAFFSMIESIDDPARRSLLEALVLGIRRSSSFEELRDDFAAAGLAHFLAISGFNLAVLAAVAAVVARILGVRPRRRGLIVVTAIACYVAVLPAALPVMRAGATAVLMAVGSILARRWDGRAATALAAIVLLAIAPGEVVRPGFQLSFGVVFALQAIAPRLRRRWFGEPDRLARSRKSVVRSRLADAVAASVSAWAISMPIAAAHFGVVAVLGVPATLLSTPIVAGIVSLSAVSIPITMVSPGLAPIAGWMLDGLSGSLVELASLIESLPASHRVGAPLDAGIATCSAVAVAIWLAAPAGVWCRRARFAMVATAAVAVASLLPGPRDPNRMAATFLDVGDGTAIVVEAGGTVVLVDSGSLNHRTVGSRVVVPALFEMGVGRLDAIVVSHPNLDHFSGLGEVIESVAVDRLVVGEAFMRAVRKRPRGAEAALLSIVRDRRIPLRVIAEGDWIRMPDGSTRLECLHPPSSIRGPIGSQIQEANAANDASLALRVATKEPSRPFLVTLGDLEEKGLAAVAEKVLASAPMVAEVPHHGSVTDETVRMLASLPETVWVQSTGKRRLRPDRLGAELDTRDACVERFVTARDGAVRFELDRSDRSDPSTASIVTAVHDQFGWRRCTVPPPRRR